MALYLGKQKVAPVISNKKEDLDVELTKQESLLNDLQNQVDNLSESEVVDLSATTATADDVLQGKQFYNAQGELVVGGYKDMLQRKVDWSKSCEKLFENSPDEDMSWANKLDTSQVTSMAYMFSTCSNLQSFNNNFDTYNVTTLTNMFARCEYLTELDVSSFDTRNVTDVSSFIYYCLKLKTIIGSIDLINTTNTYNMFYYCINLENVTLKNIKVSLQLGRSTSWGTKLTNETLINTIQELWDNTDNALGGSRTLTLSTTSTNNIANIYVKLIDVTDEMRAEDEYIDNKKPCVVCESTDEGAMTLTEYAISKGWAIA